MDLPSDSINTSIPVPHSQGFERRSLPSGENIIKETPGVNRVGSVFLCKRHCISTITQNAVPSRTEASRESETNTNSSVLGAKPYRREKPHPVFLQRQFEATIVRDIMQIKTLDIPPEKVYSDFFTYPRPYKPHDPFFLALQLYFLNKRR